MKIYEYSRETEIPKAEIQVSTVTPLVFPCDACDHVNYNIYSKSWIANYRTKLSGDTVSLQGYSKVTG